jgi:hypothetical protein
MGRRWCVIARIAAALRRSSLSRASLAVLLARGVGFQNVDASSSAADAEVFYAKRFEPRVMDCVSTGDPRMGTCQMRDQVS